MDYLENVKFVKDYIKEIGYNFTEEKAFFTPYNLSSVHYTFMSWLLRRTMRYDMENPHHQVLVLGDYPFDVPPNWYGDTPLYGSEVTNPTINKMLESQIKKALAKRIKIIAFENSCFNICAAAGGKVAQFADGHAEILGEKDIGSVTHYTTMFDGEIFSTPSSHIQLMFPYNMDKKDYNVLAWTDSSKDTYANSEFKLNFPTEGSFLSYQRKEKSVDGFSALYSMEPEIVHFKNIDALCIQSNPLDIDNQFYAQRVLDIICKFLTDKL